MVDRVLGWLASSIVVAQDARIERAAHSIRRSDQAAHRLEALCLKLAVRRRGRS